MEHSTRRATIAPFRLAEGSSVLMEIAILVKAGIFGAPD
jgi:hypothetical protein